MRNPHEFILKFGQCQMRLSGALRHNFSKAPVFSIKTNVAWRPHNISVHHAK